MFTTNPNLKKYMLEKAKENGTSIDAAQGLEAIATELLKALQNGGSNENS